MRQLLKTTARRRRAASQLAVGIINKAMLLRAALFEGRPADVGFVTARAFLAPWRRETLNHSSAAGDQLENEHDHRDDQQQMDQATSNVADHS